MSYWKSELGLQQVQCEFDMLISELDEKVADLARQYARHKAATGKPDRILGEALGRARHLLRCTKRAGVAYLTEMGVPSQEIPIAWFRTRTRHKARRRAGEK